MRIGHAGVMAVAVYLTLDSLALFVREAPARDFYAFYESVKSFCHTGQLYAARQFVNLNAPHVSVLLFGVFALMGPDAAAVVWFAVSCSFIAVALALIAAELELSKQRLLWVVPLLLASSAFQHHWRQGQLGAVLFLLGTLGWRAARRRRASGWMAMLISVKPWTACWLPLLSPREVMRTIMYGLSAVVLGICGLGIGNWWEWAHVLRTQGVWPVPSNIGLFGLLLRVAGQTKMSSAPASSWVVPVWLVLSVLVGVITWRRRPADLDGSWLLFGLAGLLVSPIAWSYYLLALAAPCIAWGEERGWPRAASIGVALLLVPARLTESLWAVSVVGGCVYSAGLFLLWHQALAVPGRRAPALPM